MSQKILLLAALIFASAVASADTNLFEYSIVDSEVFITKYIGSSTAVFVPSLIEGLPVVDINGFAYPEWEDGVFISTLDVSASVRNISDGAFSGQSSLSSVVFAVGSSLTNIGNSAFRECSSLMGITLPDSLKSMGEWVFENCSSMTYVHMPDGLSLIGRSSFNGCENLRSVDLPDSLTQINFSLFDGCVNMTNIALHDGIENIEDGAFHRCHSLLTVDFPSTLTNIGSYAFGSCVSLSNLVIPNSLYRIEDVAFEYCTGLTNLVIPDTIGIIESEAFVGCTNLQSVTMPDRFAAQIGYLGFHGQLAIDLTARGLAKPIADEILKAISESNYGIATKSDLTTTVALATAQAINEIQSSPQIYGLYSAEDQQVSYSNGFTAGTGDVLGNPTLYNLFSDDSIQELNKGALIIKGTNGGFDFEFNIEQASNLNSNDWQIVDRVSYRISAVSNKAFLRVRSDFPYVEPSVKSKAHPTYGQILTDSAGYSLYFFSPDSSGGYPLFSGASWPYVIIDADPKADLGISAELNTSNYGQPDAHYLTINARPTYRYIGDTKPGDALGHGSGSVWWTIRPDGSLNQ